MPTFHEDMQAYRFLLQQGAIQRAYRGLMDYFQELKAGFREKAPTYTISGSLYPGYLDMTYFAIFPPSFKEHNLKIAVVFHHTAFRFEAWLSGVNKSVQEEYWNLIRDSGWDKYRLAPAVRDYDYIIECFSAAEPDFNDKKALTDQIVSATLEFIQDIESFLAQPEPSTNNSRP